MRLRLELLLGLVAFVALILVAVAAGNRERGALSTDLRASSFVSGPTGYQGLAEVLEQSGATVTRWRQRLQRLDTARARGATVVVAQPVTALTAGEVVHLLALRDAGAHVLVAGTNNDVVMRCAGFVIDPLVSDSAGVVGADGQVRTGVYGVLEEVADSARTMRTDMGAREPCPEVMVTRADTILRTPGDSIVGITLHGDDGAGTLTLLSAASVLSNAGLKVRGLPEEVVREVRARSPRVFFDEYHHDEGDGGTMGGVTLAWSLRHPAGWMLWQLAIVGLVAFLATAWRLGPVRAVIPRQRRSPLEHVRALATALGAAKGHDVAIAALIRGLHRRLATASGESRRRPARDAWRAWLAALPGRLRDPAQRETATRLARLAEPGQTDAAVRTAAHTVEDVWEALHR